MKDTLTQILLDGALRPEPLSVAVIAGDPVRTADLAARVVMAGHQVVPSEEADLVLADGRTPLGPIRKLLRMGEGGAVPATLTPVQLDAALRAVAVGLRVSLAEGDPIAPLTPREREVLDCLAEGLSNKQAARRLGISAHTVKFHVEALFAKLGASSRTEAVARAVRAGLILL
jgi:two-component system, NarL family, nitrate/nitrite response regulator NarL